MNDTTRDLADDYEVAQQAGRAVISKSWRALSEPTRTWLSKSGHYNDRGSALPVEYGDSEELVTDLEYNLGVLQLCNEVKLPLRTEKGAAISAHALQTEVAQALSFLLYHPHGQEPRFLRMALYAVRQHEMANLLTLLPAPKSGLGLAGGIGRVVLALLNVILLLASPLVLASALTSATAGNVGDTTLALYGLGFIAFIFSWVKNLAKDADDSVLGTKDEQTYSSWLQLDSYLCGDWTTTGAGAKAYFDDMLRRGLKVPPIAFDLCEALKARVLPN